MRIEPLGNRVVVERIEAASRSAGGLYLPDMAKDQKPSRGMVICVGPGKEDDKGVVKPVKVKVGQEVLFNKWAGGEFELPGHSKPVVVLQEEDIHGIIHKS